MTSQHGVKTLGFTRITLFAGALAVILVTLQAAGISLLKPGVLSAGSIPVARKIPAATDSASYSDGFVDSSTVLSRIDRTPLFFEQNIGQAPEDIVFTSNTPTYQLALSKSAATLTLWPQNTPENETGSPYQELRMQPLAINSQVEIVGLNRLQSTSSYFNSSRPSEWLRGAAHFSGVKYKNIYPNIDLEYYGNRQQVEYDFIVKPGSDPSIIQLAYDGVDELSIDAQGNAVLRFGKDALIQKKPIVYQTIDGIQHEIQSAYEIRKADAGDTRWQLGFKIADWDRRHDLVIDPVLSYSTLLGGDLFDSGSKIAVDSVGNAYVVSRSFSPGNTVTHDATTDCNHDCQSNVVVSKFSGDGSELVWTVVLSGSGDEDSRGIAVDQDGNTYIAGWTNSEDFPLLHAGDNSFDGLSEGFLTKIAASGTDLVFSTYIGDADSEFITDLALAPNNDIYLAGRTSAASYFDISSEIGQQQVKTDGFVLKISANGKKRLYARKLGGSRYDSVDAIAVNKAGELFAAGTTNSTDFPVKSALYDTISGVGDSFVTKLSADGKNLLFSTYFGGQRAESTKTIAMDSRGNPVIAGTTTSDDLPVIQAFDAESNGSSQDWDCFISKLSGDGSKLLYSSYLGGRKNDYLTALNIDRDDAIYLAGYTLSDDFPLEKPLSAKLKGRSDLFISKLNPDGSALLYSTYFGGSGEETYADIATDLAGSTYLTGLSYSDDLPVSISNNKQLGSSESTGGVFVSKLANLINFTVPNNQWQVIALPYMPPGGATVEDIFADDFGYAYKKNWYVYQYNSDTDLYSMLDSSDSLEQGTAYWILQNTGAPVTVDMPEGSYASAQQDPLTCPDGKACFTRPLESATAENRYHFLGNPFAHRVAWKDVRLLTDADACATAAGGCSLAEAKQAGLIDDAGWTYANGKDLTIDAKGSLQPWQGFWIKSYPGLHGKNPRLVFSD